MEQEPIFNKKEGMDEEKQEGEGGFYYKLRRQGLEELKKIEKMPGSVFNVGEEIFADEENIKKTDDFFKKLIKDQLEGEMNKIFDRDIDDKQKQEIILDLAVVMEKGVKQAQNIKQMGDVIVKNPPIEEIAKECQISKENAKYIKSAYVSSFFLYFAVRGDIRQAVLTMVERKIVTVPRLLIRTITEKTMKEFEEKKDMLLIDFLKESKQRDIIERASDTISEIRKWYSEMSDGKERDEIIQSIDSDMKSFNYYWDKQMQKFSKKEKENERKRNGVKSVF